MFFHHIHDEASEAVWHKSVSLKVLICVWRLLRNRLSTKDNLMRRGIIPNELNGLCLVVVIMNQLIIFFIHCPIFGDAHIQWVPNILWIILLSLLTL